MPAASASRRRERPRVTVGSGSPQVERTRGHGCVDPGLGQRARHRLEADAIPGALLVDVHVFAPRRDRGRLHGARHHEAGVLAHLGEVAHERGVTGVDAGSHARQVRPLRQGVDREDALRPVLEDRPRRAIPGELHVALVGEHGHPARRPPRGGRAEVAELAGGVARHVHPEAERRAASAGSISSSSRYGTARQPASVAPIA